MKDNVKLSIITPCFNSFKYIPDTVQSILSQKGDFEIQYIVVDGGSTDGTLEYLAATQKTLETRSEIQPKIEMTVVSEKDSGMYDALVKGFNLVDGDVVAYINSDDFYMPGAFSVVADVFLRFEEVRWLTGMSVRLNSKGQIFYSHLQSGFSRNMVIKGFHGFFLKFIQQESTFFRRDLVGCINFEELKSFNYAGDFYLWKNFAERAKLFSIEAMLAGFRFREGQLSSEMSSYFYEFSKIRQKRNALDYCAAFFLKCWDFFAPNTLKKLVNRRIIYFDLKQNCWVLNLK